MDSRASSIKLEMLGGIDVGARLGLWDKDEEGTPAGTLLGERDRIPVGSLLGLLDGVKVGARLGSRDGGAEGTLVGTLLGEREGTPVGLSLG